MKIWVAVLGLVGGLAGIVSGLIVTAGGAAFGDEGMANSGASVFWVSILVIVLGFVSWVPNRWVQRLDGLAILAFAVYGFIENGLFFIFAFIFMVIAGIMAIFMKSKNKKADQAAVEQ